MSSISLLQQASSLTNTDFSTLPIIDLSLPEPELVQAIRNACLTAGFFYVKNHGVPEHVVRAAFDHGDAFFSLSDQEKRQVDISQSSNFKGFQPSMSENVDPANRGDLHEAFDLSGETIDPAPAPSPVGPDGKRGGNLWPEETETIKGFRTDVLTYFHEVAALGHRLFPLFALALGLPKDFFDDKTRETAAMMRLLYYPPQTGVQDDRVLGIGAHTDYECFTILRQQDGIEALQVLNKQGQWISATPIPETFVINIADQLARWSNDIFVSTRHRAINRSGIKRASIPFFFGVDDKVMLEPFSTCVSADRPARYEPIEAGEYVRGRLADTYHNQPVDSVTPEGGA